MSKFLKKADDRRTRLRKIAADGNGFDFGKLLQDRDVRTGLVGLGTAGISKLFGAGWGTSALLGLGAGAAAHYGQKAYGKWDEQRKYDALSHEDKLKLEKAKQDKLYADANVATQNNKKQLAAELEAERKRTQLADAKAETAKLQGMTPKQLQAYRAQKEADRKLSEAVEREEEELAAEQEAEYRDKRLRPIKQAINKLNHEAAQIKARAEKAKVKFQPSDFANFYWAGTGVKKLMNWFDRWQWQNAADERRLAEIQAEIAKLKESANQY